MAMAHSCTGAGVCVWDRANRQWDGRFRWVKCALRLRAPATQRVSQSLGTLDCLSLAAPPISVSSIVSSTSEDKFRSVERRPSTSALLAHWLLGLGDREKLGRGLGARRRRARER